ncbi:hypothetical protein VTO42DRAFT_2277 [Malbranchea cinnamomea]
MQYMFRIDCLARRSVPFAISFFLPTVRVSLNIDYTIKYISRNDGIDLALFLPDCHLCFGPNSVLYSARLCDIQQGKGYEKTERPNPA